MKKHVLKAKAFLATERFWSITFAILFLLLAIGTSWYLRTATVDLRVTDQFAENAIQNQAINQISQQIRQAYPTLPDANVQAEAQKQWDTYKQDHKEDIKKQVADISEQYKTQFQYVTGSEKPYNQTYVLEMDPYHFWHKAVNYVDHGYVCDLGEELYGGSSCHDSKRLAPTGTQENLNLHVWLEAMMIQFVRLFNQNLDTLTIIFFLPAILGTLAVIPAFFIARKVGGNLGGFVAAIIIATHPVLMNRTIAGFADTDGYVYILSMFIIWFIIEALEAKHWWSRLTLTGLSGITVGLFSFAWGGWWFVFFVVILSLIAYAIYLLALTMYRHRGFTKETVRQFAVPGVVFATFLVFSCITVSLLVSYGTFVNGFTSPFSVSSGLQAPTASGNSVIIGWPNILTTVAELNVPDLNTIVGNFGGAILVVLAAFGLFVSMFDPKKLNWKQAAVAAAVFVYYYALIKKGLGLDPMVFLFLFALPLGLAVLYMLWKKIDVDLRYAFFMMCWLLATFFATTRGIRFLLLGIAPFAIGFGISLGWIYLAATHSLRREINKPLLINAGVAIIILLLIFNPAASYNPITTGSQAASQNLPGMNDQWWDTMQIIKTQTPNDTIITSWWDFGHWFRNLGERGVTFDGGSQNPEPGHWVGRILLTENETEAIGILRMLDCGQNDAYQVALPSMDVVPAKELINSLIVVPKKQASAILAKTNLTKQQQQSILNLTHCTPPTSVFITSNDMTGKAGVWGHFGSWDFKRAMTYEYVKSLPQAEAMQKIIALGYDEAQATELYYAVRALRSNGEANGWISPWPGYFTQDWVGCIETNKTISCPMQVGLTQTSQGTFVIEGVSFNTTDPYAATIQYGIYSQTGRLGGNTLQPTKVVYANVQNKSLTTTNTGKTDLNMGVLIRKSGTDYSVLLADPLQINSMYTQLYYLDGVFNEHFTKFIDKKAGGGIVVWNVNWPQD